jgi:hypothetical protein
LSYRLLFIAANRKTDIPLNPIAILTDLSLFTQPRFYSAFEHAFLIGEVGAYLSHKSTKYESLKTLAGSSSPSIPGSELLCS